MNRPAARVRRLGADPRADFARLHCAANESGWCQCVAWWVPGWEGFGERTAAQNAELRSALFARGVRDGFVLEVHGEPVGWCQAWPRDELPGLAQDFELAPDSAVVALPCVLLAPSHRGQGWLRVLLEGVLAALSAEGVRRVEAYPRLEDCEDPLEAWNGPRSLWESLGFRESARGERRAVLARSLSEASAPQESA